MLEWLRNGWILELREPTDLFWIGGHGPCPEALKSEPPVPAKIWNPDFFDLQATAPGEASWSVRVSRETLVRYLEQTFVPKASRHRSSVTESTFGSAAKPPRLLVSWKPPEKAGFFKAVERIQAEVRAGTLKKAVPVVCASGFAAVTNIEEFLIDRLLHALSTSDGTGLRVYGHWRLAQELFSGVVGLTPEDLFRIESQEIKTMAVAGTAPLPAKATDEAADEAAATITAKITAALLGDSKEREEHELVIEDIAQRLSDFPGASGVEIGETGTVRFRQLLHLVTPIRARLASSSSDETVRSLIGHLHPTPALGVAPRVAGLSLLKQVDDSVLPNPRAGFGAPFVVMGRDQAEAVVAIRQLRFKSEGVLSDRLELEILSGCGIVAASQPEKEWVELQAKRQAVGDALGLSREVPKPLGFASRVIRELVARGVRHFVVCAGARNAPLVVALDQWKRRSAVKLTVESFFDERAASFYALGIARASARPVAVVTTSGTAVTELHSAMAEADLSGVPLIALTADRPKRLRFSGAPQSLRQDAIFSYFAGGSLDLEEGDAISLPSSFSDASGSPRPWHLNVCFEEPLLADAEDSQFELYSDVGSDIGVVGPVLKSTQDIRNATAKPFTERDREILAKSLLRRSRYGGVAIVGKLSEEERAPVREFLLKTKMPCLLEGSSGLRGDAELRMQELCSGDRVLQQKILKGEINQAFRFGGVPTTRVWRDLDDPKVRILTTSVSTLRFAGLGRGHHIQVADGAALKALLASVELNNDTTRDGSLVEVQLLRADREQEEKLAALLERLPHSEPAWVRALSEEMEHADLVYVGNSLPIRWWDWMAIRRRTHAVEANRGVNGIDGQISTALGLMRGSCDLAGDRGAGGLREAWILIGDLTALYDLSGPWALQFEELRKNWKLRIVVLNNSGGLIFRQVLKAAPSGSAPFENAHAIGFQDWAKMWGLGYHKLSSQSDLADRRTHLESMCVLEVVPSEAETAQFWAAQSQGEMA